MSNILIVAENFKLGGLETNILTMIKLLRAEGHTVFFATQKNSDLNIIEPLLEDVFYFEPLLPLTGSQLIEFCEEMGEFLVAKNIDRMHIHPYVTFIPASVAAAIHNIPFDIIVHSPMNLSAVYGGMFRIAVKELVMAQAQKVYCVSPEVMSFINNLNSDLPLKLLPNAIDTDLFASCNDREKSDFFIVSRIDGDKLIGLKEAVKYIVECHGDELDANQLIIVGDGEARQEFEGWINKEFVNHGNIKFIGRSDNIAETLKNAKVVFGMGRVALEACSLNVPVVLTGYDGLKGFVTHHNIDSFFENNFSGRYVSVLSNKEIFEEYKNLTKNRDFYLNREWIEENVSIHSLKQTIEEDLASASESNDRWALQIVKVCKACPNESILDLQSAQHWLSFVDLKIGTDAKLAFGLSTEIIKVKEENKLLSQQLGMVRQNLLDMDVYKNTELSAEKENQRWLRELVDELKNQLNSEKEKQQLSNELISSLHAQLDYYKQEIDLYFTKNHQLEHENRALVAENEVKAQTFQLVGAKIHEMAGTKFFKGLNLLKRFKLQFVEGNLHDKKKFSRWLNKKLLKKPYNDGETYSPLVELYQILENGINLQLNGANIPPSTIEGSTSFIAEYQAKYDYYKSYLEQPHTSDRNKINAVVKGKEYKGIVVYPAAVPWEPMQRPQQMLRIFAQKGYLCFFVHTSNTGFTINEVEPNFFVLNEEAPLLGWLRSRSCLVLCTWMLQTPFIDLLPHKVLWYDILDRLDFLDAYGEQLMGKHEEYVEKANIVTYSALSLKEYLQSRDDAVYLPNGVNMDDFKKLEKSVPKSFKEILSQKKPIIGYYGAIEEWFDVDLILEIAKQKPDWNIVLIGKNSLEAALADQANIHCLKQMPYYELLKCAQYFNVAIIPFIVNQLTNSVSPVKFFEYLALGLPVVSTPIAEMLLYKNEFVRIAENANGFIHAIQELLDCDSEKYSMKIQESAARNQWVTHVEQIEESISKKPELWHLFANVNLDNTIAVMTASFLGFKGNNYYSGGAERYLLDLNQICREMGYKFKIFQYGDYSWVRRFRDIEVISLSKDGNDTSEFSVECLKKFNQSFYETVYGESLINIYSAFFEGWPDAASPSIGISHGVAWDGPNSNYKSGIQFWENNRRFIESAKSCDTIVSVDTNTANWFQTIDYSVGNSMKVVPNYVDLNEFQPGERYYNTQEKVIILYPRRLYEARGLYLVLDIMDDILKKYPFVEFHFVGKGFEKDTNEVKKKQKKWGSKVQWKWLDPELMHTAYKESDIALIPTLYSEGTSLSCLEAMASGNAVISTRIGGLTDLIINDYNGYLIDPNRDALKKSIERLLEDRERLVRVKKNAIEVAKAFSKDKWKESWREIISAHLPNPIRIINNELSKLVVIYISTESISSSVQDVILSSLTAGDIVYVISDSFSRYEQMSFGRIQFMPMDSEVLTKPEYIMSDEKCKAKVVEKYGYVDKVI